MNLGGPVPRPAPRRWLRTAGLGLLAVAAAVAVATLAVPLAVRALIGAVTWLFDASVSVALSASAGASAWSMVATLGRATAAAMVTREASTVVAALVVVAAAALYGLQRLLGFESDDKPEEPSQ